MTRGGSTWATRAIGVSMAIALLIAVVPGLAAADARAGGRIAVAAGERVDGDLNAVGGTVVVSGTVDGDLEAYAGSVRIEGEVTGDVDVFGGNVVIDGAVGGDVDAAAGNVVVGPDADVGGPFTAAAGAVRIDGRIGGNTYLAAGSVTLGDSARIGGNLVYAIQTDGEFVDEGATVTGSVTRSDELQSGPLQGPIVPWWVLVIYGFLANLLLGAALLVLLPDFTARVLDRVVRDPLRSAGRGLLVGAAVAVVLVVLAVTIVGIPLAVLGAGLLAFTLWGGLVYGRFAVGVWLLSLLEVDHDWLGLAGGLLVLGLVARVPVVGPVIDAAVILAGLGGLVTIAYEALRWRRPAGGL